MKKCSVTVCILFAWVIQSAFSADRTTSYTYNALGQIETIDGPRTDVSDVTTFGYDANNRLNSITDALGHAYFITLFDAAGRPLTAVDPNGLTTTYTYDPRGRLATRSVDNKTTVFTPDAVGNIITVTGPTGLIMNYGYDTANRLTSISDNQGNAIAYTLDAAGNRTDIEIRDPNSVLTYTQSQTFDELRRLLSQVGGANQVDSYAYDRNSNLVSATGGKNNATTQAFDGLNRLITQTDPYQHSDQIVPNALNQITSVVDKNDNATNYTWNEFGDLLTIQSPDTGTTTFTYDEAGNVLTKTDANAVTTSYTYDALNRLTGIQYSDTNLNTSLSYDQGTHGIGRLTGITLGTSQVTSYSYDIRGNLIGENTVVDGLSSTTGYAYNDSDQLIQITYPSGDVVDYIRNVLGNVIEVQLTQNGIPQTVVNNVSYEPFGPVSSMTYGNGIVQNLQYDLAYRLTNKSNSFQDLDYVYDAADNLLNVTDLFASNEDRTYTYDLLNRLETRTSNSVQQSYTYDPVGNRLTETVNSATDQYGYNPNSNRLDSITGTVNKTYSHDANGNTTSDGVFNYVYGDHNRLVSVKTLIGAPIAEYAYNADNQRIKKTLGSTTTYYYYGPNGRLIAESDAQGDVIAEYIYLGSQPIAINTAIPDTIGDDSGSGFSFTGKWDVATTLPGFYGSGYHQINSKTSGGGFKKATWSLGVQSCEYEVFARWPADSGNIPDARFTVNHTGGSTQVIVNQTQNGAQWNSLGTFTLNAASSVELSNQSTQTGIVLADAIKLVSTAGLETYYIHTDHLKTPTALTDSGQTVVWSAEYDPFGSAQVAGSMSFNLRFPGQYFDQESGLHYNYFRYYDPETGRYINSDPIGLQGGLNTYTYVYNNPLRYIDTYGLWAWGGPLDQSFVNAAAGFGDGISSIPTLGLYSTADVRNSLGINGGVNQCSASYIAGKYAGYAWGAGTLWAAGLNGGANSVFWSGYKQGARGIAESLGGTTLESTPIGRALDFASNTLNIPVFGPVWSAASATFAANASGKATAVILSETATSVWVTIESRILTARGIPIIFY